MEDQRLKNLREEWETSRETKNRLAFMKSDAEAFQDQLKKDRRQAYMEKKKNFDLEVAAERAKRLEERREKPRDTNQYIAEQYIVTIYRCFNFGQYIA